MKHCVLVGDPQQLPSTVFLSKPSKEYHHLTYGDRSQAISTALQYESESSKLNTQQQRQGIDNGMSLASTTLLTEVYGAHLHDTTHRHVTLIPRGLVDVFERSLFERL